ncbi:MAG: class I adenylate-forming enzyme family protein [Euzebya sp.]
MTFLPPDLDDGAAELAPPWLSHYPEGVPRTLELVAGSMLDAWDATVKARGHSPGVHYFERSLTFSDLDSMADALAGALLAGKLRSGDRVGLFLQNDPQWLIGMVAAWKAGAVPVAINPMLKAEELAYQLTDCSATVLICLESLYEEAVQHVRHQVGLERIVTTHPMDAIGGTWLAGLDRHAVGPKRQFQDTDDLAALLDEHSGGHVAASQPNLDDIAVLTYTSGTTGPPKGAMNLHRGMLYNALSYARWFGVDATDVILGMAPLFHITGIVAGMATTMVTGAPLVLSHRFDATETLRLIERWGVTFGSGAITAYIALMNSPDVATRNLSTMTKVSSGGAPVSPATVERFAQATGIRIHNIYGLTESTSQTHLTPLGAEPPTDPASGALSIGVPAPGVGMKVVSTETGEILAPGQVGELVLAGPMVVPGYWEKPDESRHALRDGWLYTGDVGFMDDQGWCYLVDRKKDLINASGYKVWPREVEDVLYQHPAVREAAVVGVPDEYRGETVKAFVSLVPGTEADPDEIVAFCRQRMAAYKYPRSVDILAELPKTPSGKLLRRHLRKT